MLDRRNFLAHAAEGISGIALAHLLAQEGMLLAGETAPIRPALEPAAPLQARAAHFPEGTPEHDALTQITTEPGSGSSSSSSSSSSGGTPPAVPTGVSFTQDNPGDAVAAGADADAAVTLWRAYQRAAGSADAPVLVASAAALPTSFTIAPGDYEFTMTAGNAGGESAPSAPVTLTVA